MKIWVQQPMTEKIPAVPTIDKTYEGALEQMKKVARPGTEFVQNYVKRSTLWLQTDYALTYNNMAVIESALSAEKEGCDAVLLPCFGDPGLYPLRGALNIPVVGIAEASYLFTTMLGRRAAVVTVQPEFIPTLEAMLKVYGFRDRMIWNRPIRAFDMTNEETGELCIDPYKSVIPKFEVVARECIEDGADTIIAGCGWLGPALMKVGYNQIPNTRHPVPVVDPVSVGVKMTEAYVDLYKSTGILKSGSVYFRTPRTVQKILRESFGVE